MGLRQFVRMKDDSYFKRPCSDTTLVEKRGLLVHGKSGGRKSRSKFTPNKNGAQTASAIPSWAIDQQHTVNLSKRPVDEQTQPAPRTSPSLKEQNQFLGLRPQTEDARTHSPYMRDQGFTGNAQTAVHYMGQSHVTPLLSIQDVAIFLNISTKTVRRLIARQDLPCSRIGRSVRFQLSDVQNYIGGHRQ